MKLYLKSLFELNWYYFKEHFNIPWCYILYNDNAMSICIYRLNIDKVYIYFDSMNINISTASPNVTGTPCDHGDTPLYVGFVTAGMAVVFYGTTYIPVKKFDTGDGTLFKCIKNNRLKVSFISIQYNTKHFNSKLTQILP